MMLDDERNDNEDRRWLCNCIHTCKNIYIYLNTHKVHNMMQSVDSVLVVLEYGPVNKLGQVGQGNDMIDGGRVDANTSSNCTI